MLPLASTRCLLHGATIASHHHHGRQPLWSAGHLHATVTSRRRQPPPSPVAASSRRPSRSGRGGAGPGDGARHSAPGWSETTMTAWERSLLWWPGRAAVRRRCRLQSPWPAAVVATVTVSPRRRPPPLQIRPETARIWPPPPPPRTAPPAAERGEGEARPRRRRPCGSAALPAPARAAARWRRGRGEEESGGAHVASRAARGRATRGLFTDRWGLKDLNWIFTCCL